MNKTFFPELISDDTVRRDTTTTVCDNLRPVRGLAGYMRLQACGSPMSVISGDGTPLLLFVATGGTARRLIVATGRTISAVDIATGSQIEVGTVTADILSAIAFGGDSIIVMTAAGPWRARYDVATDAWSVIGYNHNYRAVTLRAEDANLLTETVGQRTLSRVYTNEFTPSDTDRRSLVNDLTTAYINLADAAMLRGEFLQPALCRYRLKDDMGRELFTSPPVLLCASDGVQCGGTITLGSSNRQTVNGYTVTAQTWRIALDIAAGSTFDDGEVALLEVLMTPQMHPYSPSADGACYLSSRNDTNDFVRIAMPGNAPDSSYIRSAIARLDSMEQVVATVHHPFASAKADTVAVTAEYHQSVDLECSIMTTAMRRSVSSVNALTARLMPPHTFTASTGAAASAVTLWGDITAFRYEGYPLACFAASKVNSPWRASIKVEFADGTETAVWQGQGTTDCPSLLNPVLCYPSPDAVRLTVALARSGAVPIEQSFTLSPDASGRYSVYVNPEMKPFAMTDTVTAYVAPTASECPLELRSVLACADAEQPLSITGALRLSAGTVTVNVASRVAQSSWDFGRSRFYTMTDCGIYSVAVNSAHTVISAGLLDARGVVRKDAAALGDGFVAVATDGGDLLAVRPSKVETLRAGGGYAMAAWCDDRRELWGISADGTADVICLDYDRKRYRRPSLKVAEVLSCPGYAFAKTANGIVDLCHEDSPWQTDVAWTATVEPAGGDLLRLGLLRLDIGAMSVSGHIQLTHTNQTVTASAPLLDASIAGEVRSPLFLRPMARRLRWLTVSVAGKVSHDFALSSISINYDR
jgi:hypothetical protein